VGLIGDLTGLSVEIESRPCPLGDARRTGCDGELARRELGFDPRTNLRDGLTAQLEWILAGQHDVRRPVAA
jgi:nucleoside-diphosphate-sugar epimerase